MHPKDPNPQGSGEQKAEIQLTLKTLSSESEWTSHACGHRLWTKKQKLDTLQRPLGFVLILMLGSHAYY